MTLTRPRASAAILDSTAAFAWLWVVARAAVQSITIDEADTYLVFAGRSAPSHWEAAANNHMLNSMLMRLFTSLFGVYHLTVRLPALIGAAVYIGAAWMLARRIGRGGWLAWATFVCLTFNPFVMDHLVAARGYSLALGFLLLAIACGRPSGLPYVSICLALSFAANFSFALADAAVMLFFLLWHCSEARTLRERARIAAECILPGLLVAAVLTGPMLMAWPRGELTWGTTSLARMLRSVGRDSFYRLNPYLLNPPLYEFAARWRRLILPALAAAWLWRVAVVALSRERRRSPRARRMLWLSALALGSALLAIAGHWALFRMRHILLPLDRTAVYLAPLLTLAAAVPAAIRIDTPAGRASRRAVIAVLSAMACYFVLCLRLTWFKEWEWDASAKQLYSVVSYYHHRYGVREVATNWRYTSVMNFYEAASGHESFAVLPQLEQYPPRMPVYVLYLPSDREFVESQGLKIVYQDEASGGAVAIHPGICLAAIR